MADEENIEEGGVEEQPQEGEPVEEAAPAEEAGFAPPAGAAKPDVYTALLAVTFVAFFIGLILAGNVLYDYYDVRFWILSKK